MNKDILTLIEDEYHPYVDEEIQALAELFDLKCIGAMRPPDWVRGDLQGKVRMNWNCGLSYMSVTVNPSNLQADCCVVLNDGNFRDIDMNLGQNGAWLQLQEELAKLQGQSLVSPLLVVVVFTLLGTALSYLLSLIF